MSYITRFALQLAVALGVLEILCRFGLGHKPTLRFDPRYDRLPAANQPVVEALEGFSRGRTNELGNLDSRMPSPLPPHAILAMGDSLTEARQVRQAERWTDRLSQLTGRRVYNTGHTGWSPVNALEYLQAEKQHFVAEHVVLQVSGNDIDDLVAEKRPHVVVTDGELAIKLPKRKKAGFAAKINQVKEIVSKSALGGNVITAGLTVLGGGNEGGGGNAQACSSPSAFHAMAAAWLLGKIRAEHNQTVVVYFPVLDYYGGCYDKCATAGDLFRSAASVTGLPFIDATNAMCVRFWQTRQPLNGFWNSMPGTGHLNSDGHAVVAQLLADYFASGKAAP